MPATSDLHVAAAARVYRRLWRAFLCAGIVTFVDLTPLLSVLIGEVIAIGTRPFGSIVNEAIADQRLSIAPFEIATTVIGVVLLFLVGRWSPRTVFVGGLMLAVGAPLYVAANAGRLPTGFEPGQWDAPTLVTVFEVAVWVVAALDGLAALAALTVLRLAPSRALARARLAAFANLAHRRTRGQPTYRTSRLWWVLIGLVVATFAALVVNYINVRLFREGFLRQPMADGMFGTTAAQEAYNAWLAQYPTRAIVAAVADLLVIVLIIALFTISYRFFWRFVLADAKRLLADPAYRPNVFLRSFAEDAASVRSKRLLDRMVFRRRRLEEIAVDTWLPLGATIAIGQPGERLPKLGALRTYYPDDQWQAAVIDWLRRAHLIAIVAGSSRWTLWEFRQVLDMGLTDKLVLLLPPDRTDDGRRARWTSMVETSKGSACHAGLLGADPIGMLAAVVMPDGEVVSIRGNGTHQSDYEAAVQVATAALPRP
jgi:hypothetical protein